MPFKAHRHDDDRACGATTVVTGQSKVYVNNKLWAVVGDKNTHGGGALTNTTGSTIFIENKNVIVHGPDQTTSDCASPKHLAPTENQTAEGSPNTFCY